VNDLAVAINAPPIVRRTRHGLRSLITSFFLCGIRPATAAKGALHISLRGAALVHLICAMIAIFSLIGIIAGMEEQSFGGVCAQIVRDIKQDPGVAFLATTGNALLIESIFFILACVFMPWGAVDEPLRASFSHAFRRAWCQSPHVALCIILIALLAWRVDALNDAWTAAHPVDYPKAPDPPLGMQPNTPESDAYDQRMQEYWNEYSRIWSEARAAKPWYLRDEEAMIVFTGFACGIWFLSALLRAVEVRRTTPPMLRQPRCDACGYDLTTMPMDSRCPECGEPVADSLGPDARPGTPWQSRHSLSAWWTCAHLAIFKPARLGRMLRLQSPGTAHRRFLFMHLPLILLIGASAFPALTVALSRVDLVRDPPWAEIFFVGLAFGTCCTVAATMVSLGTASLCGTVHHIRDKRNLLTGAVQVVCYLVPFLILWEMFGAATAIGAILLGNDPTFIAKVRSRSVDPAMLAFLLWFVPNLLCGLIYWRLAYNAVAATRYANR